jgi:hypothetical protein
MIYFSLNYVVLCTRPSRPRPQLYDMDGRYHSEFADHSHERFVAHLDNERQVLCVNNQSN